MNDGISKDLSSLSYVSVEDVVTGRYHTAGGWRTLSKNGHLPGVQEYPHSPT